MKVKDLEIIHVEVPARTTSAEGSLWSSQADKRAVGICIMWELKERRQARIGQKKKTARLDEKQGTKDHQKT